MRPLIFTFLFIGSFFLCNAQTVVTDSVQTNQNVPSEKEKYTITLQQVAEFPGGINALAQFISENLNYPKTAFDNKVSGTVYINFFIDEQGTVFNPTIVRGVSPELDAEAMRLVQSFPTWNPPIENGKPIVTKYTIPIKFTLPH